MSSLYYRNKHLYIEDVNLETIARKFGTPCYVYSHRAILHNWQQFANAFDKVPTRICYAVKANSNLHILKLLAQQGAGFDIVSVGELERVLAAGGDPQSVIFSGVGKKADEIKRAIEVGIGCFNVESLAELQTLLSIAKQMQTRVPIALRVNPNVHANTHAHIATGLASNKFGIEPDKVLQTAKELLTTSELELIGIATHIGSQITDLEPFLTATELMLNLYQQITNIGHQLKYIDIGGGLGITYQDETPPSVKQYAIEIQEKILSSNAQLILEPGRAIIANAGVLLTQIQYLKQTEQKNFAIVDAGMNDLLRPALYDAWQPILPLQQRDEQPITYDIAGPVCESADFLGKNRQLAIKDADYLAIDCAGAYGFSMSSNYNSRPRAAEVMIYGDQYQLIRRRETIAELFAHEQNLCIPV